MNRFWTYLKHSVTTMPETNLESIRPAPYDRLPNTPFSLILPHIIIMILFFGTGVFLNHVYNMHIIVVWFFAGIGWLLGLRSMHNRNNDWWDEHYEIKVIEKNTHKNETNGGGGL